MRVGLDQTADLVLGLEELQRQQGVLLDGELAPLVDQMASLQLVLLHQLQHLAPLLTRGAAEARRRRPRRRRRRGTVLVIGVAVEDAVLGQTAEDVAVGDGLQVHRRQRLVRHRVGLLFNVETCFRVGVARQCTKVQPLLWLVHEVVHVQ